MRPLARSVDLLIAGEEDLRTTLGIPIARSHPESGGLDERACVNAAERVVAEYGVRQVAIAFSEHLSSTDDAYMALLYDGPGKTLHRGSRHVIHSVDRIGGGDSFAAGLIFAQLDGRPLDKALRFAIAARVLKHTIVGDFNRASVAEVERLATGEEVTRVRR
jgi:2-dehydro-3-deoxygluconokinase